MKNLRPPSASVSHRQSPSPTVSHRRPPSSARQAHHCVAQQNCMDRPPPPLPPPPSGAMTEPAKGSSTTIDTSELFKRLGACAATHLPHLTAEEAFQRLIAPVPPRAARAADGGAGSTYAASTQPHPDPATAVCSPIASSSGSVALAGAKFITPAASGAPKRADTPAVHPRRSPRLARPPGGEATAPLKGGGATQPFLAVCANKSPGSTQW